jgi:hypothetical protein
MPHLRLPLFAVFMLGSMVASGAESQPVTDRPMNNADGVFRFAILPDRTGGMRPGVFETAIGKLNLLQPEFVLSTGDLIDGYTTDPKVWNAQWEEFERGVNSLQMPFYYVPGNHDISNPQLLEAWKQRRGSPWWSFVHKDVLFISLHTEDLPGGGLGEEQIAWARRTLTEHPDVRWIMLFFHRPLWRDQNQAGFEQIRDTLKGRKYTVFASHYHHYLKGEHDGMNYYVLATAGGGSELRGVEVGEFDHVTWVTMKPDGPVVANLELAGILPDDVVTEETYGRISALREGRWLRIPARIHDAPDFTRLEIALEFLNPTDHPLRVRGSLSRSAGVEFMPSRVERIIPPQETLTLPVLLKATGGPVSLHGLNEAGLEVTLTGSYDIDGNTVTLPATQPVRLDWKRVVAPAAEPVVLDGDLAGWSADLFTEIVRPMVIKESWDWQGSADGRFRFAVQQREGRVYVAVETVDDHVVTATSSDELQDKLFVQVRTSKEKLMLEGITGTATESIAVRATASGLAGEFSFPLPVEEKSFHLNVGWQDHDRPENTKPSVLWWRDPAMAEFGEFVLAAP